MNYKTVSPLHVTNYLNPVIVHTQLTKSSSPHTNTEINFNDPVFIYLDNFLLRLILFKP